MNLNFLAVIAREMSRLWAERMAARQTRGPTMPPNLLFEVPPQTDLTRLGDVDKRT